MPHGRRRCWTIDISKETDLSLRRLLGAQGMKKGDISKFVEEAARWRILDRTVRDIKARNGDVPAAELQTMIDQAVREVRAEMRRRTALRSARAAPLDTNILPLSAVGARHAARPALRSLARRPF